MDLGSRDYSLNFRGFEHNDPERVQRFKAFCEANFSLSPDRAHSILSSSATTVLTHSGSLEELEALAKVLREIGALVDVSEPESDDSLATHHLPSTQELHRLFGRDREEALHEGHPVVALVDSKPNRKLRSTLDLLTVNVDVRAQRKALRGKTTTSTTQQLPRPKSSRGTFFAIGGALVGLTLAGAAAVMLRGPSSQGVIETPSVFGMPQRPVRQALPLLGNTGPVKNLITRTTVRGVSVEAKVLVSAKSLSISSLAISAVGTSSETQTFIRSISDGATFRRAEAEPSFLKEIEPGVWQGDVIVSIFSDGSGEGSRLSRTYQATIRLTGENVGSLELRDSLTGDTSPLLQLSSPN